MVEIALEKPAFGQVRVANELTQRGQFVSPPGVRSVWLRHDLETHFPANPRFGLQGFGDFSAGGKTLLLKGWTVEILATDLNDRSVETAKSGIYGDYALRSTSELFKRKYFSPLEGKKLQVRPDVKKLVTFSRLNLQDDSKMLFMKGMDLVFCCNVLIYFDVNSKSKVINHFFSNLNFGGYFFLGTAESLMKLNDQFHLVHFPGAIGYWKHPLRAESYDLDSGNRNC